MAKEEVFGPTLNEASAKAGVSYQRIGYLIKTKKWHTKKVKEKVEAVRIRISKKDFEQWLKERDGEVQ